MIFMLNLFLISASSSGAVPFGTILAILLLWFLISVPLSVAGYFYGMKHGVGARSVPHVLTLQGFTHPVRVNSIPRQIPPAPWYLQPIVSRRFRLPSA